jgi:hypothetical protein
MLVKLPSGATAPLEVPSLPSLLAAGGDPRRIAAAAFVHEEVSAWSLSDDDAQFIADWAVGTFAETEDGTELAVVCDAWGRAPSQALGITDLVRAFDLDRTLYLSLRELRTSHEPEQEGVEDPDGRIIFTTPGG